MTELQTAVEGQIEGQEVQPEVQPEAVETDEMFVRVPKSNFGHLTGDADFNKVVHMANQYKEAQDRGLFALDQKLADSGLDPYGLLRDWNAPVEDAPQPQQQQVQQEQQAGQYITPDQLQQSLKEQREQDQSDREQRDRDATQKQQSDEGFAAQQAAVASNLDTFGYKDNPVKFTIAGTDQELSPVRDLLITPAILRTAQRIHAQGLNPRAPDYEDRLYGPMSAQTIQEATATVKQVMALIGQEQLETEADNQADLPQASLGDGPPGGRVKKDAKDMSEAEIKAAVNQHVKTRRSQRGG